jgi:hypothetical protein
MLLAPFPPPLFSPPSPPPHNNIKVKKYKVYLYMNSSGNPRAQKINHSQKLKNKKD